jgi:hypothetical protein
MPEIRLADVQPLVVQVVVDGTDLFALEPADLREPVARLGLRRCIRATSKAPPRR